MPRKATGTRPTRAARKTVPAAAREAVWTPVQGRWTFPRARLVQSDLHGATSCFRTLEFQDYTCSFSMILTGSADQTQAETKILFSDASSTGQPYRVDFIYPIGVCRITAGGMRFHTPLALVEGQEHQVQLRVYGNRLDLDVDDLQVFRGVPFGKRSDGCIGFGTYNGTARFTLADLRSLVSKKCFVVMPFDQKRDFLYEYVLRPMLESHPRYRFEFERGDESLTTNRISQDIVDSVERSNLIIADVTVRNPNVFYEIGYSHCRKKKTILLVERIPGQRLDLPFDTQDFRHEPYEFSKEGFEKLRRRLEVLVEQLLG